MPGRMSINWLLNESDEDSSIVQYHHHLTPSEHQESPHICNQDARNPVESTLPSTSEVGSFSYTGQQGPTYQNLSVRQSRSSSMSSRTGSMTRPNHPRPPRPKYSGEEDHFIWYQRIDLGKDWKEVSHAFNDHFRDRNRDGESGLQCRFYRILEGAGIPNIRTLKNGDDKERMAQFGLFKYTCHRYSWMLPKHRDR